MSGPFYREALNAPIDLGYEPIAIERPDAPLPPLPKHEPGKPGPVVGRWYGPRQNGRLARALPDGKWKVEWSTPIGIGSPAVGLQQTGNRIVLQGPHQWELFDAAGPSLRSGQVGPSDVLVDAELGVFYTQQHRAGQFQADSLEDGKRRFVTILGWATGFQRTFLGRLPKGVLVTAGWHRQTDPHGHSPKVCGVESYHLGDPPNADEVGVLRGGKRADILQHKSRWIVAAQHGETFVIGLENGFHVLDASLTPTASLTGKFTPLMISLDEAGRIHAIVNDVNGTQCYWHLTPKGEHLGLVAVPRSEGEVLAPPILGYDHTAYVVTSLMVRAFDAAGELQWESELGGRLGGAAVTGDDRLIVAAGNAVSTFTVEGEGDERTVERAPLIELEGETLATAPLLIAEGKLLVASTTSLFCLTT